MHPMALSWRGAGAGPAGWDGKSIEVRHPLLAIRYRVFREGGKIWQSEVRLDSDNLPARYPLEIAIGS